MNVSITMKISELTYKQKQLIAYISPEFMADNRPKFMADYRPEWMADNRPEWMAGNRGTTKLIDIELPEEIIKILEQAQ